MLFFSFFLFLSQLFLSLSFPLALGGMILMVGVGMALVVLFVSGALFSVSFFMVLVGGVLVVFGYTVSLVPFTGKMKETTLVGKNLGVFVYASVLLCVLTISLDSYGWGFYKTTDVLYFCSEWGVVIILLSVLLFLVMVTAVSVAGKQQGALIK
uniref:NADH dehydrogenase subunit 6 n=1 Tax=Glauconome virens TaxID=457868 RepID=UPI00315D7EF8